MENDLMIFRQRVMREFCELVDYHIGVIPMAEAPRKYRNRARDHLVDSVSAVVRQAATGGVDLLRAEVKESIRRQDEAFTELSKKLGGEIDSVVGAKCAYLGHRIEEVVLRCDGVLDHVGKADSALETATGRCENRGARLEIAARRCEAALARAGSPAAHARASSQFAGAPDGYASSPWTTPARQASPPIQSSSDATAGAAVSSQRRTDGC